MIPAAVLAAVALIVTFRSIVIVPNDSAYILERLGRYFRTLQPGLHVLLPVVDRVAFRFSLLPQDLELPGGRKIRYQVIDPQLAAYAVADHREFLGGAIDDAAAAKAGLKILWRS